MIAKPGPQSVSHAPRRTAQRPTAGQMSLKSPDQPAPIIRLFLSLLGGR